MGNEPQNSPAGNHAEGETSEANNASSQQVPPPIPPTLPGVRSASASADNDMRFAPPVEQPQDVPLPEPPVAPEPEPLPRLPMDTDTEVEIPTSRKKVYTPPEDRYPPIRPQRELPPEIERSPNLYPPKKATVPPPKKRGNRVLNGLVILLTVLVIGGIIAYGVFIFQNPYSALNPLAPPTPFPQVITATFLPPTETPFPTLTDVPTDAPATDVSATSVALSLSVPESATEPAALLDLDTKTPLPLSTNVRQAPGQGQFITLEPSPAGQITGELAASIFPFQMLEPPGVIYAPNGNGRGCEWSSIAGTVVDLNGEPRNGLRVRFINQLTLEENTVFTGSSATFGDGGFEFVIGTAPEVNGYFVQVFSEADVPISEQLTVVTSEICDQNVAIVNFEQTAPF